MNALILTVILAADYGNVMARVDHVYDGDTIIVSVDGWPAIAGQKIPIRLNGVDCPEMTDKDPVVKEWAHKAQAFTQSIVPPGTIVQLIGMQRDGRFRIDAVVQAPDGRNVASELIKERFGRVYDGKKKRTPWTAADCKIGGSK